MKRRFIGTTSADAMESPIDRLIQFYSAWHGLKRTLCWLIRVSYILKDRDVKHEKYLPLMNIRHAKLVIVKYVQDGITHISWN